MLVIFDFDGTLADTWPWLAGELVAGAARLGHRPVVRSDLEAARKLDSLAIFAALGIPMEELPALAAHIRRRAEMAAPQFRLFERIPELIRTLHGQGTMLAVVSSNSEATVRTTLGPELAALIAIYGCDTGVFEKAAAFAAILRRAGVGMADAVAVGDETRDLEAARAAGIRGLAVAWGFAEPALLRKMAPGRTAASVEDLLGMIGCTGDGQQ